MLNNYVYQIKTVHPSARTQPYLFYYALVTTAISYQKLVLLRLLLFFVSFLLFFVSFVSMFFAIQQIINCTHYNSNHWNLIPKTSLAAAATAFFCFVRVLYILRSFLQGLLQWLHCLLQYIMRWHLKNFKSNSVSRLQCSRNAIVLTAPFNLLR